MNRDFVFILTSKILFCLLSWESVNAATRHVQHDQYVTPDDVTHDDVTLDDVRK
jgi:hypothetical protein